jgi:hypothetical protein
METGKSGSIRVGGASEMGTGNRKRIRRERGVNGGPVVPGIGEKPDKATQDRPLMEIIANLNFHKDTDDTSGDQA